MILMHLEPAGDTLSPLSFRSLHTRNAPQQPLLPFPRWLTERQNRWLVDLKTRLSETHSFFFPFKFIDGMNLDTCFRHLDIWTESCLRVKWVEDDLVWSCTPGRYVLRLDEILFDFKKDKTNINLMF
jgi:hypothetical protein